MAKHKWDDEWGFLDKIYSTCAVCGGTRVRNRVAGVDFVNLGGMSVDTVGKVNKGWHYENGTPRSCPGEQEQAHHDQP